MDDIKKFDKQPGNKAMLGSLKLNWLFLKEANQECWRARAEWSKIRKTLSIKDLDWLSAKEKMHHRNSVYRINELMCLYARLRRTTHNTQLGVVCGLMTHLLDYFYDHCAPTPEDLEEIEQIIFLQKAPAAEQILQNVIYRLAALLWSIVPNPHSVKGVLENMLATQRKSLLQNHSVHRLNSEDLIALTRSKGHHSICLYCAIANPEFDRSEADHLREFGYYLQYLDDLEDFYEDRSEGRISLVSSVHSGSEEARRLLLASIPELERHYHMGAYETDLTLGRMFFYHNAMILSCKLREHIKRTPSFVQKTILAAQERAGAWIPFVYIVPIVDI